MAPTTKTRSEATSPTKDVRAGRCVIAGKPNVGKSTLLNAALGQKLAIVASKPGTTRTVLLGVFDGDVGGSRTQIAFLDTPGLEKPKSVLGRVLVEEAQGALEEAHVIVLLADAYDVVKRGALGPDEERILALAKTIGKPVILALGKVDQVKDKTLLLPILQALHEDGRFPSIVPVSGLRRDGVDGLMSAIREHLPEGRLLYEEDVLTDKPERFFASELVREAVLAHTRQEVPHGVAVVVDEWVDEPEITRISVTIIVSKDSHKGILIGAKGAMLKQIGQQARLGIESLLDKKVFLKTFVKVISGWTEDAAKVKSLTHDGELP